MYYLYLVTVLLSVLSCIPFGASVDHAAFKTCQQSSFCRRCRKDQEGTSKFAVVSGSFISYSDFVTFEIYNKDKSRVSLVAKLEVLEGNTFHMTINEKNPLKPRYIVTESLKSMPRIASNTPSVEQNDQTITLSSGTSKAIIQKDPLKIDFYQNDVLSVSMNGKGLMRFEYLQDKSQAEPLEDPDSWEEEFNSHRDSKPNGPEAIAMDFTFPEAEVLFGIPEHADSFALKQTQGTDPYRLYNLDTGYYETDSKMGLYGSVPVIYGHGPQRSAGVFWHNSAETWVDITGTSKPNPPTARFMSESGIIDVFILLGPSPLDTFKQYSDLTGTAGLPQFFTLGYHQCRWNYDNETDVKTVAAQFDNYDIPMDTMWLDIEYTDAKKYFTWDPVNFSHPLEMIKNLTDSGRHLTIIIDPHYKRETTYFFHNYCTDNKYYTKFANGSDFIGQCWPGTSSYPDFFNPAVRAYYSSQFKLSNFRTSTADVMIWNDMNEPSVFDGPEMTMLKDNIHFGGWEHRDVHNIFGHHQLMGTFAGLLQRDSNQRPFILTRSHFAGSQRYAIIWTGDNTADWSYLQHSIKMCLSEAVAGFSFCGADVGGFFNDPEIELVERWYQAASFIPFYRAHANMGTKRREPWLFPEKTTSLIREAIRRRYTYLPMWYTMFYEHEKFGYPVMRPLLAHYPKDSNSFNIDFEYLLHDHLLVRPVMERAVTSVNVYFPSKDGGNSGDRWFDIHNFEMFDKVGNQSIPVDDQKLPVYQRGGSIIPKKETLRRTALLMKDDPFTLVVCLNKNGYANGTVYIDDEKSYDYRHGKFIYARFEFSGNTLKNSFISKPDYKTGSNLNRVIIAGLEHFPKSATLYVDNKAQLLTVTPYLKAISIDKAGVNMAKEFSIVLNSASITSPIALKFVFLFLLAKWVWKMFS
ncbi:neutral alpha-glucosidase AB-like [Episyrphus balteatus]|uniref:neutral alpha-glucosidase AB-like n=1 Tax=Episyrphus balteatus TaxID=286459 RepID=UPI002485B742|nr:neutral alpha-glucosidase AB-like [Episyrphus balteatus]